MEDVPVILFMLFPLVILPGCCPCCTPCTATCCGLNQSRPATLTITFMFPAEVSPYCTAQPTDIEITVTYDEIGAFWKWIGYEYRICELPPEDPDGFPQDDCEFDITDVQLSCLDSTGVFELEITGSIYTHQYQHSTLTCSPLGIGFVDVDIAINGECTGLLTVEITE